MAIADYEVKPLFAEAQFRVSLADAISEEQVEFIKNLKMVENRENLISENLYIFEEPELLSIKEAVQEALDVYASDIMGITQKLYVTQSWSLTNNQNVAMHGHSHSNSLISGSLYYCELPTPVARMIFDRHRSYQQLEILPQEEKRNIYNTPLNIITPKTHDLLLFPSGMQHYIEPNLSPEPRHVIAFNTFIRGKLGDYRDVSELNLA